MVGYRDLAITGELVVNMPESERWFEVTDKPFYEELQSFNNPDKMIEKLALSIKLSDGRNGTYYPNKRSHRAMARITKTTEMDEWVGKKFLWGKIMKTMVAGQEKDVLYITDAYPKVEKVK